MQKINKFKIVLFVILLSFMSFANSNNKGKKMISVGVQNFQGTLDPRDTYLINHFIIIQCLMDTLLNLDESGSVAAELVKKWDISKDRLSYTFELNEKHKFQDGSSITSEDVAYSLSRHLWKDSQSVVEIYLEPVVGYGKLKTGEILKGIEILSNTKFRIKLNRPTSSFLYVLTMPGFSILSKKTLEQGKILGSGRMTLKEDKDKLFLKTWENYNGKKPTLEEIKLVKFNTPKEQLDALNNGKIDMGLDVIIDDVENLRNKDIVKDSFNTLTYNHLFYNLVRNPLFKDFNFRKDFSLYLQSIGKGVASGSQFLEYQPTYFPKGIMPSSYYDREDGVLTDIGFADKWKNKLKENKVIIGLLFELYPKDFIKGLKTSINSNNLNIEVIDVSKDFGSRLKEKNYDVITGGYMGNFPDPDGFIEPLYQGREFSYGVIPTLNKSLAELPKINAISDKYLRLEKYSKLFKQIEEDFVFVSLFKSKAPFLYSKNLKITKSTYRYESELWKIFWKE